MQLFETPKPKTNDPSEETIAELFEFWKETFNKRASTLLDDARRKKISVALRNYSMDTCKAAIIGCSLSSWHSGQNPNNKKYHDLSLIFRNAEKVEYFLDIHEKETKGEQEMEEWLRS